MHAAAFTGKDGIDLYYQVWKPELDRSAGKAALIIVHGFGEHCGRWRNVLDYFPARGYAVYIYDQRGFGRSPGMRGYINSWSEYREDLHYFVDLVQRAEPDLKRFIYSHSMGGAVSLDYALHYPQGLSGVIASAPGIGKPGIPRSLYPLARILSRIRPAFSMKSPMSADLLSRDPDWVKFVLSDPLSHGTGTARFLWEFKQAGEWVNRNATRWGLPLLLMHGTADGMASIETTRRFAARLTYPDVQLIEYEGGYHEIQNDILKDQVFADVEAWLYAHN